MSQRSNIQIQYLRKSVLLYWLPPLYSGFKFLSFLCFLSLKYYIFFYLTKCLGCCLHSFYHCRTWRRKLAQPDFQSVLNLICHIFWVWHHACYLSDRQEQQPGSALPAVRGALCMLSGRRSIEYAWVSVLRQTRSLFQPKSSQLFLYLPVLDWTREPSIFLLFKKLVVI